MRLQRIKLKHGIAGIVVFILLQLLGVFTHIFERNFYTDFHYPYDGDVISLVRDLRSEITPKVPPINSYDSIDFLQNPSEKCKSDEQIRIVFLVKSAVKNFNNRIAIRSSWGFEKRFSDVEVRTVFLLGTLDDNEKDTNMRLNSENEKYKDIVQADFLDTYFNNTIKTMVGFRWAAKFCSNSKFYMFVDDDYYVSLKNVLRYLRNPTNYPKYLEDPIVSLNKRDVDFELPDDVKLYTGFVFISSPLRNTFSKWYITLDEYPYHMWPPYVTAGAYILSRDSLLDMFYASYFTQHFRFDDIYVGLLAYKVKIEPYHCNEFYFYKKEYYRNDYTFTVASHGFNDPGELMGAWTEQKGMGNA